MFKPGKDFQPDAIEKEALGVEKNYVIQKNDYLKLDVYSNQGERIIDPNAEIITSQNNQVNTQEEEFTYLVDPKGIVKLPMLGELNLEGITLRQAEEILQDQYKKYYKDPFVRLTYANKRVIVLGAVGGQVIRLENQNVNLAEILSLAKGVPTDGKAQNIRVLRKDQVFIIDMSTIEGYKAGNMRIEPNDIVYVEPVRKPFIEGLRDYSIIFSAFASMVSLVALIITLSRS